MKNAERKPNEVAKSANERRDVQCFHMHYAFMEPWDWILVCISLHLVLFRIVSKTQIEIVNMKTNFDMRCPPIFFRIIRDDPDSK